MQRPGEKGVCVPGAQAPDRLPRGPAACCTAGTQSRALPCNRCKFAEPRFSWERRLESRNKSRGTRCHLSSFLLNPPMLPLDWLESLEFFNEGWRLALAALPGLELIPLWVLRSHLAGAITLGLIGTGRCSFPSRKLEPCHRQPEQGPLPNTTAHHSRGRGCGAGLLPRHKKKRERNVLTVLTVPSNMLR